MADGRKTCLGCGEEQPVTNFHKQGKYLRARCKMCVKGENVGSYAKLTPEQKGRYKATQNLKRYGLTYEQNIDMMLEQDFCCGICTKPMAKVNIDHDHSSGKVRGLLCTPCNTGLGKLGDTVDGLKRAIKYLESV